VKTKAYIPDTPTVRPVDFRTMRAATPILQLPHNSAVVLDLRAASRELEEVERWLAFYVTAHFCDGVNWGDSFGPVKLGFQPVSSSTLVLVGYLDRFALIAAPVGSKRELLEPATLSTLLERAVRDGVPYNPAVIAAAFMADMRLRLDDTPVTAPLPVEEPSTVVVGAQSDRPCPRCGALMAPRFGLSGSELACAKCSHTRRPPRPSKRSSKKLSQKRR
jgi:ribosomal protein S27AE